VFASGVVPHTDLGDVRALARALRDVDVVHVHRGKEHWLAAVANRLTRAPRPLVRTRHIVHPVRAHAANRWLYGKATALVVTVTDAIRRQYLATGLVPAERIVAIPGGADVETFTPGPADDRMRAALGGIADAPLVGMVGGFRVMKGHGVAIEAIRRLAETGTTARFVFAGRGPHEGDVRQAIFRHELGDRVTVAGYTSDVPAAMRALDVGLYTPVESDGMSRVVFEYLACGVPLVAARVGVVPEILTDGEHALLVPAGDAPALGNAIARLVADEPLRRRLARAGRRLVEEQYSGARVAATLERHYERLDRRGAVAPAA
jgi:glycosyltransferase involved in cell wall biosynthesis